MYDFGLCIYHTNDNMILIIMVFILLLESCFCFLMKKRSEVFEVNRGLRHETDFSTNLNKNALKVKRIAAWMIKLASDFTFLFCKVVGVIPFHLIRMLIYKYIFHISIGKRVVIYYGLETRSPWNIRIGDGTIIGDKTILDARFGIDIGENVNFSTGVWIWTQQHDVNSSIFATGGKSGTVIIKDRAWISSRTSILPGCVVEKGCVLATHAVLAKPITEPFSIYGGVPAKKIGIRNRELLYEFDGNHRAFL